MNPFANHSPKRLAPSFSVLAFLLFACSSPPPVAPPGTGIGENGALVPVRDLVSSGLSRYLAEPFSESRTIDVLVATNRDALPGAGGASGAPTLFACDADSFGVNATPEIKRGICRVNVPRLRAVGAIDTDKSNRADSNRFLKMMGSKALANEDEWLREIDQRSSRGLLIFVHGFNVKFEEAVFRAAQIAYDLKFQGGVLLMSWPAGPKPGILESARISKTYEFNRENAKASVEPFARSLERVLALGVPTYLTVHSMGHQVVLPALAQLQAGAKPMLEELFLNAPDFPVAEFQSMPGHLRKLAKRVTLYCSNEDNAIAASSRVNSNARLGACARFDGIDVINVSEVDAPSFGVGGLGHGYYASRAVLTDIFQAILGVEASRRLFIRGTEPNMPENFFLRP